MSTQASILPPVRDAELADGQSRAYVRVGLDALLAERSANVLGAATARGISLAALRDEPEPPKDLDVVGERVAACMQRLRHARLDFARAAAIVVKSKNYAHYGSGAFTYAAEELANVVATARLETTKKTTSGTGSTRARTRDSDRKVRAMIDDAFAMATEAVRRNSGFVLHIEQILAALALAEDCCVELATGEGKTVTAVLPATLRAWTKRGVHVVTVNDYLARRDADTNRGAFEMLGVRLGIIQEGSEPHERREAYRCDITYAADKQFIFDFLRDRLAAPLGVREGTLLLRDAMGGDDAAIGALEGVTLGWRERIVQRGLYAAIIDEADSVLIDDSVTPAIISSGAETGGDQRHIEVAARIAHEWKQDELFTVSEKQRRVALTDAGRLALARAAREFPSYHAGPRRREALLIQALVSRVLYERGRDYVIREGKIEIVDRSTGRVLPGRVWELGLHQAVEAKEGLEVSGRRTTAARSSYQGYFRRYAHMCGMSGTCMEVGPEMWTWYRLPVVKVPTHKKLARTQGRDVVHVTQEDKFTAVVGRVRESRERGQPVLVGTWSIEASERLAIRLREADIACDVLNAERESEEALIVARAGEVGAVTVATNMAGRGTDIRIGPDTAARGGLLVIATERHDERRVDRQLFGRSGRQGDPGRAETFVSLEDELIRSQGFKPLVWLVKRSRGPIKNAAAWLLWTIAQANASRRWRIHRSDAAKASAWHDKALHHVTR